MAAPRKRPADLTGKRNETLTAQHQEELAERATEISLMNAQKAEEKKETVDYTDGPATAQVVAETAVRVEVKNAVSTIRVNTAIEQMTFGKTEEGVLNNFDFEEGRTYKVPQALADHLEELGYLWH